MKNASKWSGSGGGNASADRLSPRHGEPRGCFNSLGFSGHGGVSLPGDVSPWLAITLRVLNAAGFLAVAVVNGVVGSGLGVPNTIGDVSDANPTPVTPSGYAFSIWSLIYIFQAILFLVYQFTPCVNRHLVFQRIGFWHVALCAFNIAWIFAFCYAQLLLSAVLIWAMLGSLAIIYVRLYTHYGSWLGPQQVRQQRTWVEYFCIYVPWALYTSWLLGASLINIFTAIGSPVNDIIYGGLGALAAAGFVNLMILAWTRDVWFAGVNVWTLIAIADNQSDLPMIWGAAVTIAGVVGAAAAVTWARNVWDLFDRGNTTTDGQQPEKHHPQFLVSSTV